MGAWCDDGEFVSRTGGDGKRCGCGCGRKGLCWSASRLSMYRYTFRPAQTCHHRAITLIQRLDLISAHSTAGPRPRFLSHVFSIPYPFAPSTIILHLASHSSLDHSDVPPSRRAFLFLLYHCITSTLLGHLHCDTGWSCIYHASIMLSCCLLVYSFTSRRFGMSFRALDISQTVSIEELETSPPV